MELQGYLKVEERGKKASVWVMGDKLDQLLPTLKVEERTESSKAGSLQE